jgi:hypothetical protein
MPGLTRQDFFFLKENLLLNGYCQFSNNFALKAGVIYEKTGKDHRNSSVGYFSYPDIPGLHSFYFQGEICGNCQNHGQ